jgi:hypothetical protein
MRTFLSGLYINYYVNGLLVEDARIYSNGKRYDALTTTSINQVQINASEFRYPTGFKVVRDVRLVTERAKQMSETTNLVKDFFADPKGISP